MTCAAISFAGAIATALGGQQVGSGWTARCPAHDDHEPSLSICDGARGKVLVRCHAGCGQSQVLSALRAKGLWPPRGQGEHPALALDAGSISGASRKSEFALRIWSASKPAAGTLVEAYLRARGLRLSVPLSIRFHPALKHPSGAKWPAMIAPVTRGLDRVVVAIHRTFLARDGSGKAPVNPAKMMLGPCASGAVHLAPLCQPLLIGEGIETCLAAMQATGHCAWAALSTVGLRALDLPRGVDEITILADGDDPGEAAARESALRWKREGRRVRIARAPRGMDFNDMLTGCAPDLDGSRP